MLRRRPQPVFCEVAISPDDPIYALRTELAREIARALGGRAAQGRIAKRYGIPRPRMSELCLGNVKRCSIEWLIRRIHNMGGTVTLTITLGDPERERWIARVRNRKNRRN